jgi:hypothetical protein
LTDVGVVSAADCIRVVSTTTADAPDAPPMFIMTDTLGWGGIFTIDEDLYVWGRSNNRVEEAPDTPHISPIGIVNIHRMRLDQSSGLTDYTDVGPNLLTLGLNHRPESVENVPVVQVLGIGQTEPGNFNGSVVALNDKSLVIYSMYIPPTTVGVDVLNYLPPVFVVHPENATRHSGGGSVTFTAQAITTGTGNTLAYSWTKDGSPITGTVVSGVATLTFNAVLGDNGSVIRCTATDSFGYAGHSLRAILTVTSGP